MLVIHKQLVEVYWYNGTPLTISVGYEFTSTKSNPILLLTAHILSTICYSNKKWILLLATLSIQIVVLYLFYIATMMLHKPDFVPFSNKG